MHNMRREQTSECGAQSAALRRMSDANGSPRFGPRLTLGSTILAASLERLATPNLHLTNLLLLLALIGRRTDSTTCTYGEWSAPRAVEGVPQGSMMRDPWLALNGDAGYVVGNDVVWLDDSPVRPHPFIATTLDGRNIGKPAGNFWFVYPRAVLDPRGTLHVVWAEPDSQPNAIRGIDWPPGQQKLASLWYATYRSDDGWSTPTIILQKRRGQLWWLGDFADVTLDSSGHVLVAVSSNGALVLLRRGDASWHTDTVPADVVGYTQVATGSERQIYIAYLGSPGNGDTSAVNSVMLVRSLDGGRTWLAPQVVYRGGTHAPQDVKLLRGRDEQLYLLWTMTLGSVLERGAIALATSRDAGATWIVRGTLGTGGAHLRATLDRCDAIHVTYVVATNPPGTKQPHSFQELFAIPTRYELWCARWDGTWSQPRSAFPNLNSLNVDFRPGPEGKLILMWSGRQVGVTGREVPFRPYLAELAVDSR